MSKVDLCVHQPLYVLGGHVGLFISEMGLSRNVWVQACITGVISLYWHLYSSIGEPMKVYTLAFCPCPSQSAQGSFSASAWLSLRLGE